MEQLVKSKTAFVIKMSTTHKKIGNQKKRNNQRTLFSSTSLRLWITQQTSCQQTDKIKRPIKIEQLTRAQRGGVRLIVGDGDVHHVVTLGHAHRVGHVRMAQNGLGVSGRSGKGRGNRIERLVAYTMRALLKSCDASCDLPTN